MNILGLISQLIGIKTLRLTLFLVDRQQVRPQEVVFSEDMATQATRGSSDLCRLATHATRG